MKLAIDEFKTIPGVIGCCIYSAANGIQTTNLPTVFKADRLTAIGKQLFTLHSAGSGQIKELRDISIYFDEAVIVARLLRNNLLIYIICELSFNQNLLVMTLNLLEDEFDDSQAHPEPGTTSQRLNAKVTTAKSSATQSDVELSALFNEMRSLLGKILGPMAGYVFDETFSDWQKLGNADLDHIDGLIDMLNHEIEDTEKIEYFQKLINPELEKIRKD